ncbi:hypothetical protein CFAEC_13700 (plasmid) [Corynebacterium faecale]|uniref:hypothetical protein n=1 Tax=Corynebacterium faecale TaxID=1758466 RepID=UPI0025B29A94|nr:hypothetical protein [Corynebacterium faecale]WJY93525.1 hypothetical protein CFAEC_13700 [Corynebacterium faecale]
MTDVVLVSLITGSFTLLAGPAATLAKGWWDDRNIRIDTKRAEDRDQLQVIRSLLLTLNKERRRWVEVAQFSHQEEKQREYASDPQLFRATQALRRNSEEAFADSSFQLFHPELRDSFDTFRTEWDELTVRLLNHPLPWHKGIERTVGISLIVEQVDIQNSMDAFARRAQEILIDDPKTSSFSSIKRRKPRRGWVSTTRPWVDSKVDSKKTDTP